MCGWVRDAEGGTHKREKKMKLGFLNSLRRADCSINVQDQGHHTLYAVMHCTKFDLQNKIHSSAPILLMKAYTKRNFLFNM